MLTSAQLFRYGSSLNNTDVTLWKLRIVTASMLIKIFFFGVIRDIINKHGIRMKMQCSTF